MTKKIIKKSIEKNRYPYEFLLMYAIYFGGSAAFSPYIPLYLKEIGLTQVLIGILFAIGPLVAMLSQPVWGIVGDRSKSKNRVLLILLAGAAVSIIIFPVSTAVWYVFFAYIMFTFFNSSINPLIDTIALEGIEKTKWKFGPIRMGGVYGYSLVAILSGIVLKNNLSWMFLIYAIILMLNFAMVFKLPVVEGHQHGDKKVSLWVLLKNKRLVLMLAFGLIIQSTLGFYFSFFSIYFEELGGDSALLGWAMSVSALAEIPFLMFADKIVNKLGIIKTMTLASIVTSARWVVFFFLNSAMQAVFVNLLHGFTYIVVIYCMAIYINENVQKELRASGQALNGVVTVGISRIIGSVIGGYFSDIVGLREMFLYCSVFGFIATLVINYLFLRINKVSKASFAAEFQCSTDIMA
ncbi:MAG TPA: MFS transporter [Clostridiaceae bacterium]|nr:MFS transporter [Clostridiaceae bacterium]